MITVTDLCDYAWCPYQVYLKKVRKIRPPPTPQMVRGIVVHKVREETSKRERPLLRSIVNEGSSLDDIRKALYTDAYRCAKSVVLREKGMLNEHGVDPIGLLYDLKREMLYDSVIKAARFKRIMDGSDKETALETMFPSSEEECMLEDRELGLRGRIDRFDRVGDTCIPVDYKSGRHFDDVTPTQRLQISAYAMIMERVMGAKVPLGMIEYTQIGRTLPVVVDDDAKEEVLRVLKEVKKIVNEKIEPEKNKGKRCSHCSFREHCT